MKYIVIFFLLVSFSLFSQEICDNGIDDDADGLIDLMDSDCWCSSGSLIPNPSFEDHSCCPNDFGDLHCADTWIQASNPTSDFWHSCGGSWGIGQISGPKPDGQGIVGFINNGYYKEYIGACLISPMLQGKTYDLGLNVGMLSSFSPDMMLTVYGTPDCSDLPWSDRCPVGKGSWEELGSVHVSGSDEWLDKTISFTPNVDIHAIAIGPPCNSVLSDVGSYYYLDNLRLYSFPKLNIDIQETGHICTNDLVLIASSDSSNGTWQWYKDSITIIGENTQVLNVSANNLGVGNYTVVQTIVGSNGESNCDGEVYGVVVPELPIPIFNAIDTCEGIPVPITESSSITSGTIDEYLWDFGDGTLFSGQTPPDKLYSVEGEYDVKLVVESDVGCKDSITKKVFVDPNPVVDFTVNDGCFNEAHDFQQMVAIVGGSIVSYNWDIDDGITETSQAFSHIYGSAGTKTIKLEAISDKGCREEKQVTIEVYDLPIADFSIDSACGGQDVYFNDLSTIPTGATGNYNWDLGGANVSTMQHPSLVYLDDNTYSIKLLVTTDEGCKDSITKGYQNYPTPVAGFDYTPGCSYDSISFVNTTVGDINTSVWNYGDGPPYGLEENPKHLYGTYGTYQVQLIVSSANGCADDTAREVKVYAVPIANYSSSTVCENEPPTVLTGVSTIGEGSIAGYTWSTSGGPIGNVKDLQYVFGLAGDYTVDYEVISDEGCRDTLSQVVKVLAKPEAGFSSDKQEGCSPLCVQYLESSIPNSSSVLGWQWDLGNGEISTDQHPSVCYENGSRTINTNYSVELIVTNDVGCKDTLEKVDYITSWHIPLADYLLDPNEVNMYESDVAFENTSEGGEEYGWDFDDGEEGEELSPIHYYQDTGVYRPKLVVTSIDGCKDSIVKELYVSPLVSIYIPNSITLNGDGKNDEFFMSSYGVVEEGFQFWIYDRWGKQLYYTQKFIPWDGTYEGKQVSMDVYVYKIIGYDVFGEKHERKGRVSVLK